MSEKSFDVKRIKIPTNKARIRWGTGKPAHHHTEVHSNESIASEWAQKIRDHGAVLMHGKLNPYWFNDDLTPQPIHEPGFGDQGKINMLITRFSSVSPNGDISAQIISTDKPSEGVQYLILSPPIDPNFKPNESLIKQMNDILFKEGYGSPNITDAMRNEYCSKEYSSYNRDQLGGKFTGAWREISWVFWADPNQTKVGPDQQNIVSWRTKDPLQVNMNIFLNDKDATLLFSQMQNNPSALQELMNLLYPKIAGKYPLKIAEGDTIKILNDISLPVKDISKVASAAITQKI